MQMRFHPAARSSVRRIKKQIRFLFFVLFQAGMCLGAFLVSNLSAILLIKPLHLQSMGATLFVLSANLVAITACIALTLGLAPLSARILFSSRKISEPEVLEIIDVSFKKLGLKSPRAYWIADQGGTRQPTFVSGFSKSPGSLSTSLYVSENHLQTLTPSEFQAMLLHEASHVRLKHLEGRLKLSVLQTLLNLIVGGVALSITLGWLGSQWLLFAWTWLAGASLLTLQSTRKHMHAQELAADRCAATVLGREAAQLASALRKLDPIAEASRHTRHTKHKKRRRSSSQWTTHPDTESRIHAIAEHLDQVA